MTGTEVFVQWKGTDVCLDLHCTCGYHGHYDGDFAYNLRCAACGRLWEMPHTFTLTEVEDDGGVIQDTGFPHDNMRPVNDADEILIINDRSAPPL